MKQVIHSDCLRKLWGFADPFWLVPVYCSASLSLFWYRNSRPDSSCMQPQILVNWKRASWKLRTLQIWPHGCDESKFSTAKGTHAGIRWWLTCLLGWMVSVWLTGHCFGAQWCCVIAAGLMVLSFLWGAVRRQPAQAIREMATHSAPELQQTGWWLNIMHTRWPGKGSQSGGLHYLAGTLVE